MLQIEPSISQGDLESLRDAGVSVLVVDEKGLEELPQLLTTIQDLPESRRRRESTIEALLPRAAMAAAEEEEDEEDDEDDG